jgi:hypothetical protein
MLGFMHNWLEGILKHQLRMLWGIGPEETQKVDEEIEQDEEWTNADVSESASELDDLLQEAAEASAVAAAAEALADAEMQDIPPPTPSPSLTPSQHSNSSSTPTPSEHQPQPYLFDFEEDEDPEDFNYVPNNGTPFSFTDVELQAIRNCISNITLPT